MLTLILTVIIGIAFAFIAIQNTNPVTVSLYNTQFSNIPLFVVMLGSLLVGLLVAGIMSALDSLGSYIALHRKDSKINEAHTTIGDMQKRVHDLELENAHLRGEHTGETDAHDHLQPTATDEHTHEEEKTHKPRFSFMDRLRHSF